MKHDNINLVIVILLVLILGVPLFSTNITGRAVQTETTITPITWLILAIILLLGVLVLVYKSKPKQFDKHKKPKLYYKPKSDLQELRDYVKFCLDRKYPKHRIKQQLLRVGWDERLVEKALNT